MVDLNTLKISYLEKLAKECNITLKKSDNKAEKIKKIQNSGIPEERLKELFKKYKEEQEASKKVQKKSKIHLEERLSSLEKQVQFLISRLDEFKDNRIKQETRELIEMVSDLDDIKKMIISRILPGEAITIDKLIGFKELQKFPLNLITQAIDDLIEDEVLIGSEGNSIQKIKGKIGVLTLK